MKTLIKKKKIKTTLTFSARKWAKKRKIKFSKKFQLQRVYIFTYSEGNN